MFKKKPKNTIAVFQVTRPLENGSDHTLFVFHK